MNSDARLKDRQRVATTCPYCGVGCGVTATVEGDGRVTIAGDPAHPANRGRLCSKGTALAETLDLDDRLLYPEIAGRRAPWDAALDAVASGFARILREDGPNAVAFYCSGQLLTEDYYVANKLMKGFIGAANIDTNSRLCMSSTVAGHKRAFGADVVPGCYEDLDEAHLVLVVGSNAAWCHPVLYQRIADAKRARHNLRVVVIDPRRTPTCDLADLHLPLAPGSDAVLFNGLLTHLAARGFLDTEFTETSTTGLEDALAAARAAAPDIATTAAKCGVPEVAVAQLYHWFATTERVVTLFSQGINQSSSGTDKVNAIVNCHLATGRIGRPGMGPFSLTGQPNAMGGREVGGLANTLAAHMDFGDDTCDRVQRFWGAPAIARAPGLKAVDLFQAVGDGRIRAVWIMATNPAVSLPDAFAAHRALQRCELVVLSDCVRRTDTADCADVLLPAATWGEKDGTVTNSERRISRQRPFLPPPGEARPDWWIITQVAHRMGFSESFPYAGPGDIFREHAALSGFENGGTRAFDIGGLAALDDAGYDALAPVQWPVPEGRREGTPRLFADRRFATADRRARFVAITPRPPMRRTTARHPLVLNTGRIRDQWHTMTRTGSAPRLTGHTAEPYVEIHPVDAASRGLTDGALARLTGPQGEMLARVHLETGQRPGSVFAPIHWSGPFAACGCVNDLVAPYTDPISGEPESKHAPVEVVPYRPAWHAFLLSRERIAVTGLGYWVSVRGHHFWRYELAGVAEPDDWSTWAARLMGGAGEWLEYHDPAAGRYRAARIAGDRLVACLFAAPAHDLPTRAWLARLFAHDRLDFRDRASLLAARPPRAEGDAGPTVCSCFGVGRNTLLAAIRRHRLASPEQVGDALKAGSNCGSCVPELAALIQEAAGTSAA
ncbi:MAG TPA: molybdopterin-dependent oxidoreductase [bacterium]